MGFRIEGGRIIITSETRDGMTRRDFLKAASTTAAGLALPDLFGSLSITGQTEVLNGNNSLIGLDVLRDTLPGGWRIARPVVDLTKLAPGEAQMASLVADARVDGVSYPVLGAYGVLTDKGGEVVPMGREGVLDMAVFRDRLRLDRRDPRVNGNGVAREIVMIYDKGSNGIASAEVTRALPYGQWESADFKYRLGVPISGMDDLKFRRRKGQDIDYGLTAFKF